MSASKRSTIVVLAVMNLGLMFMVAGLLFWRSNAERMVPSAVETQRPAVASKVVEEPDAAQDIPVHVPSAGNLADSETRTCRRFRKAVGPGLFGIKPDTS